MLRLCLLLVAPLLLSGCGSRADEANYYKVGKGVSEKWVEEEILGPGRPTEVPRSMAGRDVKAKRWEAGGLKITLLFEDGKVIARQAEGLSGGRSESFAWPETATRPATPAGRAQSSPER